MTSLFNNLYRRILYFRRELISYYCYYFKSEQTDQMRVVIFAQGRTGSTLLEDLISETGHFKKHGELLNEVRGEIISPIHFINGLPKRYPGQNFIFHVKIYQLTRDRKRPVDPAHFMNTLYRNGWKIIYLKRRNKVRHELSNVVASYRDSYHKFDKKREELSLEIDLNSFVRRVNNRFKFESQEENILQHLDFHEVVYEDDLEKQDNHQETVNNILDYLSLKRKLVSTRLQKVNTTPLHKLIKNYEEFEKRIIEEGWSKYLD